MTLSIKPNEINGIPHVRRFLKELLENLPNSNTIVKSDIVHNIVVLTQAEYDALATKDANTEYNIIESV